MGRMSRRYHGSSNRRSAMRLVAVGPSGTVHGTAFPSTGEATWIAGTGQSRWLRRSFSLSQPCASLNMAAPKCHVDDANLVLDERSFPAPLVAPSAIRLESEHCADAAGGYTLGVGANGRAAWRVR